MLFQKRWSFGLGTIFSLIAVYFIFLYSRDKGWTALAFISKWYLIIVGALIALSVGIILLVLLLSLFMLLIAMLKLKSINLNRNYQKILSWQLKKRWKLSHYGSTTYQFSRRFYSRFTYQYIQQYILKT